MKVQEARLVMRTIPPAQGNPAWVRGFFANLFSQNPLFGNHAPTGEPLYIFPRIQYRIEDGSIIVLGIAEGAEAVGSLALSPRTLRLGGRQVQIIDQHRVWREVDVGLRKNWFRYRFIRPWMPLNQDNYSKFTTLTRKKDRLDLLKRIMVGNILALAKGVGETVIGNIEVHELIISSRKCQVKNQPMLVFDGWFTTNFLIPDDWAIGRGGSRGFGVVRKIQGSKK